TEISKLVTENKRGFSLIMMDVDNFKLINDAYGHQIGDRVLVALVEKSKKLIREGDFLARYGGEEFIIIFPGTSLKDTIKKAEKLCTSLAETEYAVDDRKGSQPLSFTISLGVATRRRSDTVASLISRADKALYKAKALGKNQVVSEKDID
ncbi:MAG: GGDEF domain-containing protein, partial [Nitrospirota bacterium]|nr:GGDEF domain-containing protein [Nitrospirota bacterium]